MTKRARDADGGEYLGYSCAGSLVVAYEYDTGMYLMENGTRSQELADLVPATAGHVMPPLGNHATCWLGDCTIVSLDAHYAVVRTASSTYAILPHLLRPTSHTVTVRGLRVVCGRRCLVFPSLTCTGGATALLEQIVATMRLAGLTVGADTKLLEYQAVGGPVVGLRTLSTSGRLVVRLHGHVAGESDSCAFVDVPRDVAMANLVAEDYLAGNPWALPISCTLLRERLGIQHALDGALMFGSFKCYQDCLHLVAPQRSLTDAVFDVSVEHLVVGVRAGCIEAQCDGTYAVPQGQGGYGLVRPVLDVGKLMWQLDDLYDSFLPLGTHKVGLPGCPDLLLMERFGRAYDPDARTVTSCL